MSLNQSTITNKSHLKSCSNTDLIVEKKGVVKFIKQH